MGARAKSADRGAPAWMGQLHHLRRLQPARLSAIGLLLALVTLGLQGLGLWRPLDYAGYKLLFHIRQAIAPLAWDPRIAVIAIDDRTLAHYQQFPLSRDRYTELLNQLLVAPPAAIGFDLLFVDPSPQDDAFATAIERHWTVALPLAESPQGLLLQPVPPLWNAAAAFGHVMTTSDSDGITRTVAAYQGDVPAFGAALVALYQESQAAQGRPDESAVTLPPPRSPDEVPQMPSTLGVNWPSSVQPPPDCRSPSPRQLQVYSLDCVLQGQVAPAAFQDRIVLVGVTATGIDPLRTPFNAAVPASNVYLHAAVVDNLLNDRLLRHPPEWLLIPMVTGVSLLSLSLAPYPRLRLAALALPLLWFGVGVGALLLRVWLPLAAPMAASLLAILGAQLNAQWENQQLKALLAIHLDPTAADLLWRQRHHILNHGALPAQEAIATVIFMDIRGFTTVAETLSPPALLRWLNRYLEAITQAVTARGGVVDKFVGDEVIAYFSTPATDADTTILGQQAKRAIETGLAAYAQVQQINHQLEAEGHAPIAIGIGIHTGPISMGSMGSRHRLNYSIVGDTVNVAARLEELNKAVTEGNPFSLLLSDATYKALRPELTLTRDRFSCCRVGTFKLRGRLQHVNVYTVLPASIQPTSAGVPS